jgi:phosphoenolpyruvate-protein phosphotransferase
MPEQTVVVTVPEGLHARSAAEFCRAATTFDARVRLRSGRGEADTSSVLEVLSLDVRAGDAVTVVAEGDEADQALDALVGLLGAAPTQVLVGVAASPGTGIAPAWVWQTETVRFPAGPVEDVESEAAALDAALRTVADEFEALADKQTDEAADILRAHATIARDPALREGARNLIAVDHIPAARAIDLAGESHAHTLERSSSDYLRARAADVRQVTDAVVRNLVGIPAVRAGPEGPVIIVADDLSPADTVALDARLVRGLATERGSRTSHTAILARSLGVPAVVAVPGLCAAVHDGQILGLDGDNGEVHLDPEPSVLDHLTARLVERRRRLRDLRLQVGEATTTTKDGHRVEVAANIRSLDELQVALQDGAEAIGLLRTEFLYLDRDRAPTEDEQFALLQRMCRLLDGRRLVVRTLDIGADKALSFLPVPHETNPELGVRGIRLAMRHPEILRSQLRAVVRAAQAGCRIAVMAPMVATVAETRWFVDQVAAAGGDRVDLEVGIMVEVPSAVMLADELAELVDFMSIGTNDLTQYLHAADRRSSELTALQDPFSPAVLRAVEMTCEAAHRHGAWVGVCGEAASDPKWATIAVGLGVDELSVQASSILETRAAVAGQTLDACQAAARRALAGTIDTSGAVTSQGARP